GQVNLHLQAQGVRITTGTIVDATILHAPTSTKNREQQCISLRWAPVRVVLATVSSGTTFSETKSSGPVQYFSWIAALAAGKLATLTRSVQAAILSLKCV